MTTQVSGKYVVDIIKKWEDARTNRPYSKSLENTHESHNQLSENASK